MRRLCARRVSTVPASPPKARPGSSVLNIQSLLNSVGLGSKIARYQENETVYLQGDPAQQVLYIHTGGLRLTVVNEAGKEAVVAILGPDDFCGVSCLAEFPVYMTTATALMPTTALTIEKQAMIRALHNQHALSDRFITYIVGQNLHVEERLVDQLLNPAERRLARALLLLAECGGSDQPRKLLPHVSQELLAEMVGTTRPRVNFFMKKFRKLGFVRYDGGIQIDASLINTALDE